MVVCFQLSLIQYWPAETENLPPELIKMKADDKNIKWVEDPTLSLSDRLYLPLIM